VVGELGVEQGLDGGGRGRGGVVDDAVGVVVFEEVEQVGGDFVAGVAGGDEALVEIDVVVTVAAEEVGVAVDGGPLLAGEEALAVDAGLADGRAGAPVAGVEVAGGG